MQLPLAQIFDNILSSAELAFWKERVQTGTQSTGLTEDDVRATELYKLVRNYVSDLRLIHCLLFDITEGCDTEVHRDIGEYCALFYPTTNLSTPLHLEHPGLQDIEVIENRLVLLDCTHVAHQQIVPRDESHRYSVAFKFAMHPEDI